MDYLHNELEDLLKYKGNRLFCKQCKFYGREYFDNGELKRHPCKSIDHDILQIRPQIFNGYSGAYDFTEICNHYEPAKYIKNPSFNNMEDYIEWLSKCYHTTSEYYEQEGYIAIKHFHYVTLRIPKDDIEIEIPLYDWNMGTWRKGNKIKYKELWKLIKRKDGKYHKRKLIDRPELKTFGWYEIKED